LGFGGATAQRSSVNSAITAFTPDFLAPTLQRRPLTMHWQQLVTPSSSNAVHGRTRSSLQMHADEEAKDNYWNRAEWATQQKKKSQEEFPTMNYIDKYYSHIKDDEAAFPVPQGGERTPLLTKSEEECLLDGDCVATAEALTMFAMMDLDGDGVVTEEEFKTYLAAFTYTLSASSRIFKALDANGDGEISVGEVHEMVRFVQDDSTAGPSALDRSGVSKAEISLLVRRRREEANRMFDIIDGNGDGQISATELKTYLVGVGYTEIAAESVLRSLDSNDDGIISRFELFDGFEKYSALRTKCLTAAERLA